MATSVAIAISILSIVVGYLMMDPLHTSAIFGKPFEPEALIVPAAPNVSRDSSNRLTRGVRKYEGEIVGPESIAFDLAGRGPYVSVSDGRILRRNADDTAWEDFTTASPHWTADLCAYKSVNGSDGSSRIVAEENASMEHICGRPLGLRFHPITGDLFFCDAYFGLHRVGPEGGKAQLLVDTVEGKKMKFTNDVDIDPDEGEEGTLYFTDTSPTHYRRDFLVAFFEGRSEGRVMKYDLSTGVTTVLVRGLRFVNGLALSKDRDYVVYCETPMYSCSRYWLKGEKAGKVELLVSLPGTPDNIRLNPRGRFWVGLHSHRCSRCSFFEGTPALRHALLKMPLPAPFWYLFCFGLPHGLLVEVDENGQITDLLEDVGGKVVQGMSEVDEHKGKLWVGSLVMPFLAVVDYVAPTK